MSNGSKRKSLRFAVTKYALRYKTEFEDGTAQLKNISAGGCAMYDVSTDITLHEKILLILQCDSDELIEIGAMVVRVTQQHEAAVKFLQIADTHRQTITRFFATLQRQQKADHSSV